MMKKVLQIANGFFFIITVIINYLSNTGIFNNNTMASVSARYQNLFTPAGYAFSIWGLIYLGVFAFIIYQARSLFQKNTSNEIVVKTGWWFVLSCIANCSWVLAWLYEYTGLSVLIMLVLLVCLLSIVINANKMRTDTSVRAFVVWPFSVYTGWICVALVANIAAWLTKIQWDGLGIAETSWAIIMICVAGAVLLFVALNRAMPGFSLVGVWALVAISVADWNKAPLVAQAALVVSIILLISVVLQSIKNYKAVAKTKIYSN
jgi:hypothetical protein